MGPRLRQAAGLLTGLYALRPDSTVTPSIAQNSCSGMICVPRSLAFFALEDIVASLAPSRPRGDRDPFGSDDAHARELLLRVGDTVTVLGDLRPQPADSDTSTYREAPAVELVPLTRTTLRIA